MSNLRELNANGKVTVRTFHFTAELAHEQNLRCPTCKSLLRNGVCSPGQEEIEEGCVMPCLRCKSMWALTYAFNPRRPSPAEALDVFLYAEEIIDAWVDEYDPASEIPLGPDVDIPF